MLAGSNLTRVPCAATSPMAFWLSFSLPRPFSTILAPALASAWAMPRPIPEVEPVTTAVLPLMVMEASRLGFSCRQRAVPQARSLCLRPALFQQGHATFPQLCKLLDRNATEGELYDPRSQACRDGTDVTGYPNADGQLRAVQGLRQRALPFRPRPAPQRRHHAGRQGGPGRERRGRLRARQAGRTWSAGRGQGGRR